MTFILPRTQCGGGTARSAVEGACSNEVILMRLFNVAAEAPSTALRAVPLPRFAGADEAAITFAPGAAIGGLSPWAIFRALTSSDLS